MAGLTPDIGAFLARLVRLDPAALVRIRAGGAGEHTALWGRVPWDVLVSRVVAVAVLPGTVAPGGDPVAAGSDVTVRAADWLAADVVEVSTLRRYDAQWRSPLPAPGRAAVVETIPTAVLRGLGTAAAQTLRETEAGGLGGRAVGARVVRDALLDHVAITASGPDQTVEVPQRLVQAVVRMGFAGSDDDAPVGVLAAGGWVGLAAAYGVAWWWRPGGLFVAPAR
jgi:hypothetical protein